MTELTALQIAQAVAAAFLVGFTKTGMPGLGIVIVPMLASVFGGKPAMGVLLPMLFFGDFFAIAYHRRNAQWPILAKLLPWVLGGMALGYLALERATSEQLTTLLAGLVLTLVALKAAQKVGGGWLEEHLPRRWWFSALAGMLAGFATTVGNVAGAITGIYFLSMGLKKHGFMGTGAWFYCIVNASKIPLYLNLGLITTQTLAFDVKVAPVIAVGAVIGFLAFKQIPQRWFDRAILILATFAALRLLFF